MSKKILIVAVVVNIVAKLFILGLVLVEELLAESLNVKCRNYVIPINLSMLVYQFLEILGSSTA